MNDKRIQLLKEPAERLNRNARDVLYGCRPTSTNDARCVNPVETRFIASSQTQRQSLSVQTQDVASHVIHKTTSVASGIPSFAQPYYLIYSMEAGNKGLRLNVVCAPLATEVVSLDIRK